MIVSRVSLASILAAAIRWQWLSPFTMLSVGQGKRGDRFPSTSIYRKGSPRKDCAAITASSMAFMAACRILMRSISCGSTKPNPYANAEDLITAANSVRRAGFIFFESYTPSMIHPGGSTTAHATTGPASGPRPASSTPANGQIPWVYNSASRVFGAVLITAFPKPDRQPHPGQPRKQQFISRRNAAQWGEETLDQSSGDQ